MTVSDDVMPITVYRNRVPVDAMVDNLPLYTTWHQIKTSPRSMGYSPPSLAIKDMKNWCSENTRHMWSSYIGEFFFENERDAMWFALRWAS